jgi:hypothetical protein
MLMIAIFVLRPCHAYGSRRDERPESPDIDRVSIRVHRKCHAEVADMSAPFRVQVGP